MLSDTRIVVVLHVLQHHGLRRHTGSPHGELSILCTRSDAGEGRMRVASWLQDFNERLRGSRRAHFNGLDVGHGAPRGRKMPTATSSCSRCTTAKIIAGVNHEGTGTAWPARGAVCGHGSHAAAARGETTENLGRDVIILLQNDTTRRRCDRLANYEG